MLSARFLVWVICFLNWGFYDLCSSLYRYNHQQSDPDEGARKKQPEKPRLELELIREKSSNLNMQRNYVSFYLCSVEIRNSCETFQRWQDNISLDVCCTFFDAVKVTDKIMDDVNKERIVADVIMDQTIMPGVGNIIKNEGKRSF